MKKVVFIKNAAVLTVSALLIRFLGMAFRIRVAALLGAEGVGLHQLVFSAYVLFSSFATTGLCTAVTRLCAEELDRRSRDGAVSVLNKCISLSLLISFLTVAVTFFGAKQIAALLGDARAETALRFSGLPVPFVAVTSCLRGYFTARGRTLSIGLSQLFEQIIRIASVLFLFTFPIFNRSVGLSATAVVIGDIFGEMAAFLFIFLAYKSDKTRLYRLCAPKNQNTTRRIGKISVPLTAEKYANSFLRTAENAIMPRALSAYSRVGALAVFGAIKGMAMPLILFPATVISAVSVLLIPEMSTAAASGKKYKIKYTCDRMLTLTSVISFFVAVVYFCSADFLGNAIYKSGEVGRLLRQLAPIIPLIYIDSVADGMLKGLDCQKFLFFTAVGDSAIRILLVILIVPAYGINGFLFITALSNLCTAGLKVFRLLKKSELGFNIQNYLLRPLFSAVVTLFAVSQAEKAHLPVPSVLIAAAVGGIIYVLCLFISGMKKEMLV